MEHMDVKSNLHDVKRTQDPKFLKLFTILAEGDEKERITSTENLLQQITSKQAATEEGLSKDVEYTVNRLVKGLASSRMFARLGFSVALCQVLRSVDAVTIQTVLDSIEEKSNIPQDSSKSEAGNILLGKVFGYLALIQSGRLFDGSKKHIKAVASQLMELSTEKSYLQQLCANAMVQVIAKVKKKIYKKHILPMIEKRFTAGWGDCSADTFLLILISHRHHKETVKEFLKEQWMDEQLVSEKNYAHISDVVIRSSSCYPVIHSVIEELVKEVLDRGLDVVRFWKQVVHPLFEFKGSAVPKRAVGLHIFSHLLPALDTPHKLQCVLSPDVTSVLVRYHPQRKDDLSNRAADLLSRLTSLAKSSTNAQLQATILRCLIEKPGSPNFDTLTRTSTVASIIPSLLPDASVVFVQELMNIFNQNPSWVSPDKADRPDVLAWCVTEMVSLVTSGNLPSPWRLSVLQFLLVQGFFKISKSSSNIPHCVVRRHEISGGLQQSIRDNFSKTTSKLLIHHKQGESRAAQFGQSLDILYQLVQYCQILLDSPANVQLDVKKFSDEAREEWDKVAGILKTVDKKRQSEERIKDGHAFELLFIHEGFQLFHDPEGAIDMLQDLYVCYKKSGQRRKSKAKNDEPPWIDVITELLLNLMFKGNVLCRNVANLVMTALADHVTPESLQLIVDALKQTGVENEDGLIGMEEGDDVEDNDESDDGTKQDKTMVDEDVPSSESEEEEEEEESDVEEEEVTLADKLKEKVKAALGDAAAKSDEESEDDPDLSDSEMFKLDDMLAEAFRSMRKGKKTNKEKEKQLRTFKQRVLDLVEVLVKQAPSAMLIKAMMVPLLELMERGVRKEEDKILGKKALAIYQTLCKTRKITTDDPQEREDLLAMTRQLMTYSKKVSTPNLVCEVCKGCQQVMRILLNIQDQTGPSPLKTRAQAVTAVKEKRTEKKDHAYYEDKVVEVIRAGMLAMFAHKPGHGAPAFYQLLLERYQQVIFWPVNTDLLTTIASADIKIYQRTQAALILSTLINPIVVRAMGTDSWNEFITTYQATLEQAVKTLSPSEGKVAFIKELLTVVQKIQNVTPELVVKVMPYSVTNGLDALMRGLNPEVRSCYNIIMKNMSKGSSGQKKNKKRKKAMLQSLEGRPEKKVKLEEVEERDHHGNENIQKNTDNSGSVTVKSEQKAGNSNKTENVEDDMKRNGKVLSPVHESVMGVAGDTSLEGPQVDTPMSKKKKKYKRHQASLNDSGFLNSDNGDLQSPEAVNGAGSKKAKLPSNGNSVSIGGTESVMSPVTDDKKAKMQEPRQEFRFSPKYTRSKKRQKESKN